MERNVSEHVSQVERRAFYGEIRSLSRDRRALLTCRSSHWSAAVKSSPTALKRSNAALTASRTVRHARLSSRPTAPCLPLSVPTLLGCAPASWLWRTVLERRRYFR